MALSKDWTPLYDTGDIVEALETVNGLECGVNYIVLYSPGDDGNPIPRRYLLLEIDPRSNHRTGESTHEALFLLPSELEGIIMTVKGNANIDPGKIFTGLARKTGEHLLDLNAVNPIVGKEPAMRLH